MLPVAFQKDCTPSRSTQFWERQLKYISKTSQVKFYLLIDIFLKSFEVILKKLKQPPSKLNKNKGIFISYCGDYFKNLANHLL